MNVTIAQSKEMVKGTHPSFTFTFDLQKGTFSLLYLKEKTGQPILENAGFAVFLASDAEGGPLQQFTSFMNPTQYPLTAIQRLHQKIKNAIEVIVTKTFPAFSAEFKALLDPNIDYPKFDLRVINSGDQPIRIHSLCPVIIDTSKNADCKFNACNNWEQVSFFKNGYQSWSQNEILFWGDRDRSIPLHYGRKILESENTDLMPEKGKKNAFYSDYFTLIYDRATSRATVIGFITHLKQFTNFCFILGRDGTQTPRLLAVSNADAIPIKKGETCVSEELYIDTSSGRGHYLGLLVKYASITARNMGAITGEAAGWPDNPVGWCSWYYYYTKVTEKDVLANLKYFEDNKAEVPIQFIQLDDGYQNRIGDWTDLNEKFPSGMKFLVSQIHAAGFKAGIWVAPFLVAPNSNTFISHPNWCIQDTSGKFLSVLSNPDWGRQPQYALDPTHPEVQQHLERLFNTIVRQWGFDYVKIDFVYAACIKGSVYHDKSATRVDAYRLGLAAIRRGVGADIFILGCGAPLGPSIGYCNAMRIGPDTKAKWEEMAFINKAGRFWNPSLYPALHSTVLRSFLHMQWWINDPDCVIVRNDKSDLTLAEVQTQLTLFGMSSGQILISDDLTKVPLDRINLFQKLIPPTGIPALPADLMENKNPELFFKFLNPAASPDGVLVSATNFSNSQKSIEVDLSLFNLDPSATYHIFEFWSEEYLGHKAYNEKINLPNISPHGHKYLLVKKITPGVPQIVASLLHIGQGILEIENFAFNEDDKTVRFRVNLPGERMGRIILYIPEIYAIDDTQSPGVMVVDPPDENSISKVEIACKDRHDYVIQLVGA